MTGTAGSWVLGVDSGGSGLRVALARTGARTDGGLKPAERADCAEPVRTGPDGIDPGHLLEQVVPAARALLERVGATAVQAACVGAAGMASMGGGLRARLPGELAASLGVGRLALAADSATAYAGALGAEPGAVVAAGTGMIATGTDLRSWRRADGWGHLLGDCGGGAWIGRAGLDAAMRAHDGREGGSHALLARAERVFGPVRGLPGLLYPRTDRPAVLASFAPEVAACAAGSGRDPGDPVARTVLQEAAREIARSAAAVCPAPAERASRPGVALTGGLFRLGEGLLEPVRRELADRAPHARIVTPTGGPLDGSLLLAAWLATHERGLPEDPDLLSLHGRY